MVYKVFCISYQDHKGYGGYKAVAVSAETERDALARLRGNRTVADVLFVDEIIGRKPEYEQDRIEGTCDLTDMTKPAPQVGTEEADGIREYNHRVIAARIIKQKETP